MQSTEMLRMKLITLSCVLYLGFGVNATPSWELIEDHAGITTADDRRNDRSPNREYREYLRKSFKLIKAVNTAKQPNMTVKMDLSLFSKNTPDMSYYVCQAKGPNGHWTGVCRPFGHCMNEKRLYATKKLFMKNACPISTTPFMLGLCCSTNAPVPTSTLQGDVSTNANYECGRRLIPSRRIVGGTEAYAGEFPWMAAIMNINQFPHLFCGGTLISPLHVVTAAHCFTNSFGKLISLSNIWVRLGELNYIHYGESPHIDMRIKDVVIHKGFGRRPMKNDIALIILEQPVKFTKYILPACLPKDTYINSSTVDRPSREKVTVTGWGRTAQGSKDVSSHLLKVVVQEWEQHVCQRAYKRKLHSSMFCAGLLEGGKDACQSDSGGPLVRQEERQWYLVGIVSWGVGCAQTFLPGVYTNVAKQVKWIQEIMKMNLV